MSDPKFIHLRVHSDFSMVDGLSKVPPIVKKVAEYGMPAMALTDFTNLCGLVKFYNTAHGCGVKPIIGADFTMQSEEFGDELTKLTVLASDNTGYKNLTLLISEAYQRGHVQHQPVIDKSWLAQYSEGLIILSGGRVGEVGRALLKGNQALVSECVEFYKTHFPDRFYLELTRTGRADEESYLHFALDLADKAELPVVATNDVVFITEDQFDAHEIRVAIHDGFTLEDPRRPKNYSPQQYLRTEDEMCELFSDIPEALENSVEIAKRCNVTVRLGEYFLPNFPTEGLAIEDFLIKKSKEGLERRLAFLFPDEEERAKRRPEYDERLDIELEVVNNMGFPGYFLIVMEFIQWSKDNDVPVGPGRGSGAGSLVAYALDITDLDPLEYDLLFERFLNPERVSMPDFDIDFCMDKRDQVIDHVAEMYGRDAVSQIITFGTMAAKAVIRDVGRVLGHPYGFVDRISKLVPPDPGMTLEKAFAAEPQLPEIYEADEEVKELIDMCRVLEGCTRNAGKHAGGVVISPTTITDFAPIYCDAEGNFPVTQFDKNDVETAGLVKFDFLGLRTLTIIDWALGLINPRLEKVGKEKVRIESIPLDDQASFNLLQNSETTAVFQLESRGMKELIKRLQPDCFEDIIALVALFRPGPLQSGMVDNFIDRKHGREAISYPDETWQHESLKDTLEPTYGIILYQEQVMQIAQILAGYTLGGADMLRRAMGKKKPEEMAKQRAVFEEGAVKNGVDGELAMKIFDLVEKFAGYGFNKSHSAAYALVSYQTLWLKTHYPAEFMAAVMTADMDNTEKVVGLVDECFRMKLKVLPPDINSGLYRFNVDDTGAIVYGIGAIKGVGEGPIENIIAAREEGGYFKDLFDFCARIDLKKVNKRVIEKLIYAGALDRLGPHRAAMMASLDDAVKAASQHHQAESFGQVDMFGVLTDAPEDVETKYTQVPAWPEKVWLEGERETLGLYLTGHPINTYIKELGKYTSCRLKDAQPTRRDQSVTVAGLVIAARVMTTKRGTRIGIMTLDDRSGRMEVMLFSDALERYAELLEKDKILVVSGQVSFDDFNGGLKMSAREVMDLGNAREKYARGLSVSIQEQQIDEHFFERFNQILEPHRAGTVPVNVYYQRSDARARIALGAEWRVTPTDTLLDDLKQLLGQGQVELEFN
ncbi:DNA polymerase III subunit alpha [Vibrio nigripulchritudo MADA3029]|uniref:DNA polymerase III subunit alpha n=1 Tax=Vibrio nigripulchritudo TaxID=28173 RepID=UPI00021C26D7|nr:DNA polymerase III subunit alpha [Vibrio nigripulchritudo]EGU55443.1 DNA polymerase III subunit alpha [Vibrio nigripulchritudo ATCC 27043]CCN48403.1 DNA polymerase III subunit alpha [Vibrio nigripulchritudo MADA3020]CCN52174.1 DNA polymerase III subunit alpha [Vibrio nigripulchritudo MADA3021]CCN58100.1 DNA polymerase III subunit alpha [Vibrio nigripulchritudo MADA3029]BCL68984.1 DNA-directed DNA polymerase [Vibrio nigripulchritudo]